MFSLPPPRQETKGLFAISRWQFALGHQRPYLAKCQVLIANSKATINTLCFNASRTLRSLRLKVFSNFPGNLACKFLKRFPMQQNREPLRLQCRAERTIKLDRRTIPVKHLPAHAITILRLRDRGHVPQHGLADPFAPKLLAHKQILDEQMRPPRPRRKGEEVNSVGGRSPVPIPDQCVKTGFRPKSLAHQVVRRRIYLVQFPLELGQFANHGHDEGRIRRSSCAYGQHWHLLVLGSRNEILLESRSFSESLDTAIDCLIRGVGNRVSGTDFRRGAQ